MMMILLFALATGLSLGLSDPCNDYAELPFADLRFVNNKYDIVDDPVDDRYLMQAWYRVGDEDMPTSPPKLMSCGTKMPIWLNGTIPPVAANEVSRSTCLVAATSCTKTYAVKIKNCGKFRVYYLPQTSGSDEAYCFGVGESGIRPSYTPSSATVVLGLTGGFNSNYEGYCKFDKRVMGPELFYQVTWYINGIFLTSMKAVHFSSISYILLNESNLKTLGKNVSCSVRARTKERGPPGLSMKSAEVFIGIKVLTPSIVIKRGETGVIRIQPTAPFGCYPNTAECPLNVILIARNYDNSTGITTLENSKCGATMKSNHSTAISEITVAVEEANGRDKIEKSFEAILRTDDYRFHSLWSNYTLPVIKIHVQDVMLPSGECSAHNDPHMMTFDRRPYDIQYEGDFIMYKHIEYPIQVQARFRSCSHGSPYCVWGVAVQAGRDVFVIDKTVGYADYRVCNDSALDVRKKGTTLYRIYTPIGSKIDVSITGGDLSVKIYPSVRDKGKTRGLCGTLNNDSMDDFRKSDESLIHSVYGYGSRPIEFSDSWLVTHVQGAINLFDQWLNVTSLKAWNKGYRRCHCNSIKAHLHNEINCTASMVSLSKRIANNEIKINTCRIHRIKDGVPSKRSVRFDRNKRDLYHHTKKKLKPSPVVNMTESQARSHCESTLGNSKLFQLCGNVPNVNTNHSIQMCIMDIMLSNSTDWTDSSREALQGSCLAELELNTTLETKGVPGHPSIASAIKEIACPGNCSDSGICVNGTCVCDVGFGAPDCSIDLSIPPLFEELQDSGMCDKQGWECDAAMAKGDDFIAEGHLKCNLTPFWYDIEGIMHGEMGTIVTADIQTFMNLFCPLTLTRRKRDITGHHTDNTTFIEGYHVSLSNDGIHFSDVHTLFIFDSKCQTPVSDGTKQAFVLKEGHCFINNQCIDENDINPADVCQTCNPAVSTYKWSKRTAMAVCNPVVHEKESNYLWVIGFVAGITAASVVIGLIIWRIKVHKVKRVSDSTVFTDTVRGRPSTAYSPPT